MAIANPPRSPARARAPTVISHARYFSSPRNFACGIAFRSRARPLQDRDQKGPDYIATVCAGTIFPTSERGYARNEPWHNMRHTCESISTFSLFAFNFQTSNQPTESRTVASPRYRASISRGESNLGVISEINLTDASSRALIRPPNVAL